MPAVSAAEHDASALNTVIAFLAAVEVSAPVPERIRAETGLGEIDLLVLVGNSVVHTAVEAGRGLRAGVAPEALVTGGVGHSTADLRRALAADPRFAGIPTDGRAEADLLGDALVRLGVDGRRILRERRSTNCGANAAESRRMLDALGLRPKTILLIQDPILQRRTQAAFRRVWQDEPDTRFLNCPTFVPFVEAHDGRLAYVDADVAGLWPIERLLALAMGEIPRLRDDASGYGPSGRGFIVHVDIPAEVEAAYAALLPRFGAYARLPQ